MAQLTRTTFPAPTFPERVLQFGTGVLLRGLPDYLIQQANEAGEFGGSIVVVKSTDSDTSAFTAQDNSYTVAVRGVRQGSNVVENRVVTAISRVLSAQTHWPAVLEVARRPSLQVVISNTTEVGIQFVAESIFQHPPQSYPAKLTAFLYERFKNVGGSRKYGLVVVPTELISDNGLKLREAVEQVAAHNELGKLFLRWLKYHVRFCNSLVDRIVTAPAPERHAELEAELGYEDQLLTLTEPYHFWAIEGDERVRNVLSFAKTSPAAVVIDEDITYYRERKLRLLNGTHTFTVPMGYLLGLETVYDNNQHPLMRPFIERLMLDEIAPTVPTDGADDPADVLTFAHDVLDRFRNPHIEHLLLNITLQQTAKMQARNVATLQRHYERSGAVSPLMALGFAAYLRFMRGQRADDGTYRGEVHTDGGTIIYPIRDDQAAYFAEQWANVAATDVAATDVVTLVQQVLANTALWQTDLTQLPGFAEAVASALTDLLTNGPATTLQRRLAL